MTTIRVTKTDDFIESISIKGHTGYNVSGKDIVCAAISSSAITTVNGILCLDKEAIKVVQDDGYLQISTLKKSDITNKLLENLLDMLLQIEKDYPKNVKINIGG